MITLGKAIQIIKTVESKDWMTGYEKILEICNSVGAKYKPLSIDKGVIVFKTKEGNQKIPVRYEIVSIIEHSSEDSKPIYDFVLDLNEIEKPNRKPSKSMKEIFDEILVANKNNINSNNILYNHIRDNRLLKRYAFATYEGKLSACSNSTFMFILKELGLTDDYIEKIQNKISSKIKACDELNVETKGILDFIYNNKTYSIEFEDYMIDNIISTWYDFRTLKELSFEN